MADPIPTSFSIGTKTTAATAAANYQAGAAAKGVKWATKYLQSKRDPFDAASAAADTMIANLVAVGAAGVRAGLARVNRARIAKLVHDSGASRFAQGINDKGAPNYAATSVDLIPAIQNAAANLPARGDDAANEQRMILMRRSLKAMRGQFRSR